MQPVLTPRAILTSGTEEASIGEGYSNEEKLLNQYRKLHPCLGIEALTTADLQLLCEPCVPRATVTVADLPIVSKSYEDTFLRPARAENGERSCVFGKRCLCEFIARLRYGPDNNKGFVGVEFLLPSQLETWRQGGGLPERHGKCLVCLRYFTTYLFIRSRSEPLFCRLLQTGGLRAQTHVNASISLDEIGSVMVGGQRLPSHCNAVAMHDGYHPNAMLNADDAYASTTAMRETSLGALMWKPFVRFNSSTFQYRRDEFANERILVQVGVSAECHVDRLWSPSQSLPSLPPESNDRIEPVTKRLKGAPTKNLNDPPPLETVDPVAAMSKTTSAHKPRDPRKAQKAQKASQSQ